VPTAPRRLVGPGCTRCDFGATRMSTTVLIVDDSPPIRRSLRAWFERREGWEVCGEAENGAIAVEQVKALNPDIVILDLSMPVMNGLDTAREIAAIAPKTAMVLFTMHASEHLLKDAQRAGIRDVVSKLDGPATLMASVESIVQEPGESAE
jgi:DNA-binding NarL/FixJ family response regulator